MKNGASKKIGELIIAVRGGGHKILIEGGDRSYAEIELKKEKESKTFYFFPQDAFSFYGYLVQALDIGWNGETVRLLVKKPVLKELLFGKEVIAHRFETLKSKGIEIMFFSVKTIGQYDENGKELKNIPPVYSIILKTRVDGKEEDDVYLTTDVLPNEVQAEIKNYQFRLIRADLSKEEVTLVVRKRDPVKGKTTKH